MPNSKSANTQAADATLQRSLFRQRPLRCSLAYILSLLFIWQPLLLSAQPITATHQTSGRPTVDQAANGVPIINIQTPNKGLSHNFYNDFNVDSNGLILNNNKRVTQTQLGGYIEGNPNLTGGTASLILNEVISNNPSSLNGYIEVGGARADVVVANPNGISCNGCGFINTNHATLSTGQPIMNNGALSGFDVQQGAISILGDGLNAANTSRFDIIARSVEIAGELHADALNIVTGQQTVGRTSLNTTNISSDTNKPSFAIDSTALGGMYANRIRLIANEEGVGVRLDAPVAAQNGDLQLSANGNIQYTDLASTNDIAIRAAQYSVTGTGIAIAKNNVSVQAERITNAGTLGGHNRLTLQAAEIVNDEGGALLSEGDISLSAGRVTNRLGDVYASGNVRIIGEDGSSPASVVENRSGRIQARGELTIDAEQLLNTRDFLAWDDTLIEGSLAYQCTECAGEHLDVNYTFTEHFFRTLDEATTDRSQIISGGNMRLSGNVLVNETSDILSEKNMTLRFNDIENLGLHSGEYLLVNRYAAFGVNGNGHLWNVYAGVRPYNRRNYTGGATYLSDGENEYEEYMYLRPDAENSNYDPDNLLRREDNIVHRNVGHVSEHTETLDSTDMLGANILAGNNLDLGDATVTNGDFGHRQESNATDVVALGQGSQGGTVADFLNGVNGGLFSLADPGHPYLIETNPFFATTDGFLGSAYLLNRLNWDPDGAIRLLGDGFYEQQLIRQQIVDLTGRALLEPNYVDANSQYRKLLDNGFYAAESLELAVGVTLTAEQINQLTTDIVWMVEQQVAGETVLVPQLYLSPQSAHLNSTLAGDHRGALIGAGENLINNGGSIVNSGTLYSGNNTRLNLNENGLQNLGGAIIAENTLHIKSKGDINNISGTIEGRKVVLDSIGDIINQRWTVQRDYQHGGIQEWYTDIGDAAAIRGTDVVQLKSKGGIVVSGSDISGGKVTLNAQGNINIETVENNTGRKGTYYGGTLNASHVRHISSDISSTIKLIANAANDLTVIGSHLASDGKVKLSSGNDLMIASAANSDSYNFLARHDGETTHSIDRSVRHQGSTVTGQGNVQLRSNNNLTVIASKLESAKNLSLMGVGDIQLLAARDSDYRYRYAEDDKWYGSKITTEKKYDETAHVVELIAAGNVQINASFDKETGSVITSDKAKGSVLLEGTSVQSGGDSLIYASEDLLVTAALEESYHHRETRREYAGWANDAAGFAGALVSFAGVGATLANSGQGISFDLAGRSAHGQTQQNLIDAQFSGAGSTYLLAGEQVTLEAGDYQGDNLLMSSALNADSTASTQIIGLQTHTSRYAEETTYRFGQTQGFGSFSTQSDETRGQYQDITRWHGTNIDMTDSVDVRSAGHIVMQGAQVTAGDTVSLATTGGIYLTAGQSATSHRDSFSSNADLGEYTEEQRSTSTVRSEVTSINAGGDINMQSYGDQVYQGSVIKSGGDQTYTSEAGSVSFLAVTDTTQTSHTEQSSDFSWVTMKSEGSLDETARMVSLQPGGDLIINAANGINVDLRQINAQTGPELVAALVEQNPEMAWLQQLSDQGGINWNEVQEVHERWSDESETLGTGASAVIAIVVTVFTAGAGTGFLTALGATTTATATTAVSAYTVAAAAATQAVVTSAVTQTTISTINNGGKLDRSLSDLGQKDSLRGLGASALTAGLTVGVDKMFENWTWGRDGAVQTDSVYAITKGFNLDDWEGMAGFAAHSATNGLVSAAVNDAVYGGHFSDYLRSSMESQGNDVLSAFAFNWVGTFADDQLEAAGNNNDIANAGRYVEGGINRTLLHAGVGGLITEVTMGDFATGAAAAGFNQALSPYLDSGLNGTKWRTAGSQLTGLAGAFIVGGDINAGSWIAKQADSYNRQLHSQEIAFVLDDERVKRFMDAYGLTDAEARQELLRTGAAAMDAGWAAALEGDPTNSARASDFLTTELIASGQEYLFWATEDEFYNQRIGLKELFANEEALGAIRDYASIENSFTREELWAASGEGSGDGLKDVVGVSNEQDILSTAAFLFGGDRYRSEVISNAFNEGAKDLAYMDVENRLRVMQGDWLGLERDLSRSATSMGIGLGTALSSGLAFRPLGGIGRGPYKDFAHYGGEAQRKALFNQTQFTSTLSEAKGVVHSFREMKRLGYNLEDISLQYRGKQGVDLVFSQADHYAIVEAKHGLYLSSLRTYKGDLRQGSLDYNISRMERYLDYGNGSHDILVNRLLDDAYTGQLGSFGAFYRSRKVYELPVGWPNIPAIQR
tara:strand:+ start:15409 stop:22194 length:6786 start_codon:yes stop_codon:yes gene_type:complete